MAYLKRDGNIVNIVASADIASGEIVVMGDLVGVATYPIKSGETGVIQRRGEYHDVPCDTTTADVGDNAYWDAVNSVVTSTASQTVDSSTVYNTLIGVFLEAVASTDTACVVLIG